MNTDSLKSELSEIFGLTESSYLKYNDRTEYDLLIASSRIRFMFGAYRYPTELIRPLSHSLVPNDSAAPDFTLFIIEDSELYFRINSLRMPGEVLKYSDDPGYGSSIKASVYWNEHSEPYAVQLLDLTNKVGVFCKDNSSAIAEWDIFSPLRMFFHSYFLSKNMVMLHAAAIAHRDSGIMLVGKGGSGKSSTVLSCLDSELSILSDDYLIAEKSDMVIAHSLYSNVKINHSDLNRLEFLKKYYDIRMSKDSYKAVAYLNEVAPERIINSCAINMVSCLKFSDDASVSSISSHQILGAVLPSTIKQIPSEINKVVNITTDIMNSLPSIEIGLPDKPKEIVKLLSKLLSSV